MRDRTAEYMFIRKTQLQQTKKHYFIPSRSNSILSYVYRGRYTDDFVYDSIVIRLSDGAFSTGPFTLRFRIRRVQGITEVQSHQFDTAAGHNTTGTTAKGAFEINSLLPSLTVNKNKLSIATVSSTQ